MDFSRPECWSGWPFSSPGDLPNPGIKSKCPAFQADSLPAQPQRKPKNIGVGSLCLLRQIFPTQESNRGLLHYRRILDALSYQGCAYVRQATKRQDLGPGLLASPFLRSLGPSQLIFQEPSLLQLSSQHVLPALFLWVKF